MSDLNYFLVKSNDVVGVDVSNEKGEDLGKIEEIVLDKFSGDTKYVVLSFGGLLGIGDKYFAFPWKALNFDPSQDKFLIKVDKSTLKNTPGFDKNHWPDFNSNEWQEILSSHYKVSEKE